MPQFYLLLICDCSTRVNLVLGRQSGHLALGIGLCYVRCFDISHFFRTATDAFSSGAELSFSYLSSFLGPSLTALSRTLFDYHKLIS